MLVSIQSTGMHKATILSITEVGEIMRNARVILFTIACLLICISNTFSEQTVKCTSYNITPKSKVITGCHKNNQYLYVDTDNGVQVYALNDNLKLACVIQGGSLNVDKHNYLYKNTYIRVNNDSVESIEIPSGKTRWRCVKGIRDNWIEDRLYIVSKQYVEEIDLENGNTVCKAEISFHYIENIYTGSDRIYIHYRNEGFLGWWNTHMMACYLKHGLKKVFTIKMPNVLEDSGCYAAKIGEYSVHNSYDETYFVRNDEFSKAEKIKVNSRVLSAKFCMGCIIIVSCEGVHIYSATMREIKTYKQREEVADCVIGRDFIYIVSGGSLIKYRINKNEIVVEWVRKSENVSFIVKEGFNDYGDGREIYFVDEKEARIYRLSEEVK